MMYSPGGLGRISVVLALAVALAGCSGHAGDPPSAAPVPDVLTVRPTPAEAVQELRLPGYTQPNEQARIHSRATGFVERRFVDIGDVVEAGAVLAVVSLFLFHGLHRMYHCLHDVGIRVGAGLKAVFHGLAIVGTVAAVYLLIAIGFAQ